MLLPKLVKKVETSDKEWKLAKCNVDELNRLAQAFRISKIPTLIVMNSGRI